MLSDTQNEFKNYNRKWEYELPAQVFFANVGGFNQETGETNYRSDSSSVIESEEGEREDTHIFPDTDLYDQE